MNIFSGEINFSRKDKSFSLRVGALKMVLRAEVRNNFLLHWIYGSTVSLDKRWYSLSSQLVDRKVSQFVKGKFFELFPSEICHVQLGDLWWENGEHVPRHWLSKRTKNVNEAYEITLFGFCG